jgi:hypothetical protein
MLRTVNHTIVRKGVTVSVETTFYVEPAERGSLDKFGALQDPILGETATLEYAVLADTGAPVDLTAEEIKHAEQKLHEREA